MLLQQLSTANWLSISRTTGIWESPTVHPLVVETLGGWSFTGSCTILAIAQKPSLPSGLEDKEVTCHLFQHLSVLLWMSNANMCAAHAPALPLASSVLHDLVIKKYYRPFYDNNNNNNNLHKRESYLIH